jgi:hypothetical protein
MSINTSKFTSKSSLRKRQHLLAIVRALRGSDKCCESCGNVEWIDDYGQNAGARLESVDVSVTEKGNGWVEKVKSSIPIQTRSMIFTI